ncbi:MAG: DUF4340 domain-containing protein [Clostridia bacterium]|jgi:hypothetical protein|nr:DUF4340 domain-containing protein [Clostridia bacterium]MDD4502220.1 DUF4340 domain-containing protein [Clostridia bacterium]NLV34853.1 DUF4340 domain-containing protein [Clostridiaceae bacterium]
MKNLKTIIIIVLALAVAIAAYFIIDDIISKTRVVNPNVTELITPVNVKSTDIQRYTFSVAGEQTTVELMEVKVKDEQGNETTEMQYRLVNEPDKELNDNISTALVQAAALVCVNIIEESPKDLAQYGIDYNSYFEVTLIDGTSYKVYFGNVIDVTFNVYVMREGVDKVYTISDTSFGMLTIYREYLLSEVIFPGNASSLTSFSLYKKGELEFSIEPDEFIKWKLVEPLSAKTYVQTAQEMIDKTYEMVIGEYVNVLPTEADYRNYDLFNPAYSVKVTADNKSVLLHIGRQSIEDSSYYAKFDNSDEVFFISNDYLGWIDTELLEILYPFPYEPSIKNLSAMHYVFGTGEVYDVVIEEQDYILDEKPVTNYEYTINGDIVQLQYGADLYNFTFYTTVIVDYDTQWQGPSESQKPYFMIEMNYVSGNTENIAYYTRDDQTMYYVRYNPEFDMMSQYTGTVVDSGPIENNMKQFLVQYTDYLYVLCTDGQEHEFGEWIIVKEATEEEEGLKEKICTVCGHKISAPISVIKHTDPGSYRGANWWIIVVAVVVAGGAGAFLLIRRAKKKNQEEK